MEFNGICVYATYRIEIKTIGTTFCKFDSEINDGIYEDFNNTEEKIVSGCELLKIFTSLLNQSYLYSFVAKDNVYSFGAFNPYHGDEVDTFITVLEELDATH